MLTEFWFLALNELHCSDEFSPHKPYQPYQHSSLALTESLKQIIQSSPAVLLLVYEPVCECVFFMCARANQI